MTEKLVPTIGFVGLGVMGAPMCRNVALKHRADVIAFDMNADCFSALDGTKARRAATLADLGAQADIVFLSLPGGQQVEQVCLSTAGLASTLRQSSVVADLSTTPVAVARTVASRLSAKGISFADTPVARTREAAQRGELSIMVGADADLFTRIEPYLRYMGSDVTRCGGVGCGQVVKLINNALVFENTVAIAEMMVIAERAGVPAAVMIDAVSKGSGDSFALRNHARKAMLPRQFPEKSFPPEYVLKDIGYVLELAAQVGVSAHITQLAQRYYAASAANGWAGHYYPAVIEVVDRNINLPGSPEAAATVSAV